MPRRLLPVAVACLLGAVLLASCQPATVTVAFRPSPGAQYRYIVKIHSVTVTRIGDRPPEVGIDDAVLESNETVLSVEPGEVRVRVRLRRAGSPDRTFDVRLDRAAQLAGVETVEGLPLSILGPDALPEILPGAPAAPPDRPLAPGDRWTIDSGPGPESSDAPRLQGSGRLVELRLLNGEKVASTAAVTRIPNSSTETTRGGTMTLNGVLTTESTSIRVLADGAVEQARSVTRGRQDGTLSPPPGTELDPLPVSQTIEVSSESVRVRA